MVTTKSTVNTLPYETENLQKQLLDSRSTIVQLQEKIRWYEEQFRLLKQKRFGASSEKNPDQMQLFNEAESILESLKPEKQGEQEETVSCTRKKPGRKALSPDIPREVVLYELPDVIPTDFFL
jgi:predicted  nucleic acid-binding Zn-ribbon protein